MSEHNYKFGVAMSCGGCSGAINRVLGKLEGWSLSSMRYLLAHPSSSSILPLKSTTCSSCIPSLVIRVPLSQAARLKQPRHSNTLWKKTDKDSLLTYFSTGVKSYEVSLDTQTAVVVAEPTLTYEKVLQTIQKTGKKVSSGEADGETKSVELIAE